MPEHFIVAVIIVVCGIGYVVLSRLIHKHIKCSRSHAPDTQCLLAKAKKRLPQKYKKILPGDDNHPIFKDIRSVISMLGYTNITSELPSKIIVANTMSCRDNHVFIYACAAGKLDFTEKYLRRIIDKKSAGKFFIITPATCGEYTHLVAGILNIAVIDGDHFGAVLRNDSGKQQANDVHVLSQLPFEQAKPLHTTETTTFKNDIRHDAPTHSAETRGHLKAANRVDSPYEEASIGRSFEIEVEQLLIAYGYKTTLTSARHDGGKDIIIHEGKKNIYVECKSHTRGYIYSTTVNKLHGAMLQNEIRAGIFITNNRFTIDAVEEAKKFNIKLIDSGRYRWLVNNAHGKNKQDFQRVFDVPLAVGVQEDQRQRIPQAIHIEASRIQMWKDFPAKERIHPGLFILAIGNMFLSEGCSVSILRYEYDGAKDLVINDRGTIFYCKCYYQSKKHFNNEFLQKLQSNANRDNVSSIVVSTTGFSLEAVRNRMNTVFLQGDELIKRLHASIQWMELQATGNSPSCGQLNLGKIQYYASWGGKRFHHTKDCESLQHRKSYLLYETECQALGLSECRKCRKEARKKRELLQSKVKSENAAYIGSDGIDEIQSGGLSYLNPVEINKMTECPCCKAEVYMPQDAHHSEFYCVQCNTTIPYDFLERECGTNRDWQYKIMVYVAYTEGRVIAINGLRYRDIDIAKMAIGKLDLKPESEEKFRRLVFYNLVLAEAYRESDPSQYRKQAKRISLMLGKLGAPNPFDMYMRIVEVTTAKVSSGNFGDITVSSVHPIRDSVAVGFDDDGKLRHYDIIATALNLEDIPKRHYSLADISKWHGLVES